MSKASKRRPCPAVQREIPTAECGENRGSRYSCPPDCGFSPFALANYSQLLELEEHLDKQALEWLGTDAADEHALRREIQRAQAAGSPFALHATLVWKLCFERDSQGRTCMQRWEAAGFPGLKNDHRTLARAKMAIRVVLFEVRRVLDDTRTEVVDLLASHPAPFLVFDRGLASSAVRFSTGLTWMYAMPHYQRLFGLCYGVPEVDQLEPREIVKEVVRHLGGPIDEAGMRLWLAQHFVRAQTALNSVALERQRLMFANIDGTDDLNQRLLSEREKPDLTLIPPRLLENPPLVHLSTSRVPKPAHTESVEEMSEQFMARQNELFLDDSIPALDGRTPREAARDPALRPRLIRLMKSRIRSNDAHNIKTGSNYDLNWMLRDLGLNEILFDPPPPGRVPRELPEEMLAAEDDEFDFPEDEDMALPMNPDLPPAPRLPPRHFTMEEVQHRILNGFAGFQTPQHGLEEMETNGCTLIDDVYAVSDGLVEDHDFPTLVPILALIWYIFVPPGTRALNLTRANLREAIKSEMLRLMDVLDRHQQGALEYHFEEGPQPNVNRIVLARLLALFDELPNKMKATANTQVTISGVTRAVIAELDRVHRQL